MTRKLLFSAITFIIPILFISFPNKIFAENLSEHYSKVMFTENIDHFNQDNNNLDVIYLEENSDISKIEQINQDTIIICDNDSTDENSQICIQTQSYLNMEEIDIGDDTYISYSNDPLILLIPSIYFHNEDSFISIERLLSKIYTSQEILKTGTNSYKYEPISRSPDNLIEYLSRQFISYLSVLILLMLISILIYKIYNKIQRNIDLLNTLFIFYLLGTVIFLILLLSVIFQDCACYQIIETIVLIFNETPLYTAWISLFSLVLLYLIYIKLLKDDKTSYESNKFTEIILLVSGIFLVLKIIFPQNSTLAIQISLYVLFILEIFTRYLFKKGLSLKILITTFVLQLILLITLVINPPPLTQLRSNYEIFPNVYEIDTLSLVEKIPSELFMDVFPIHSDYYEKVLYRNRSLNSDSNKEDIIFITNDMNKIYESILLHGSNIKDQDLKGFSVTPKGNINYYKELDLSKDLEIKYKCDKQLSETINLEINLISISGHIYDNTSELSKERTNILNLSCDNNTVNLKSKSLFNNNKVLKDVIITLIPHTDGSNPGISHFELLEDGELIESESFIYSEFPGSYYILPINNESNNLMVLYDQIEKDFEIISTEKNIYNLVRKVSENIDLKNNAYFILSSGDILYLNQNK